MGFRLLLLFALTLFSMENMAQFTDQELSIIRSEGKDMPFRVLKVTDLQDSLLLRQPCSDLNIDAEDPDFRLLLERMAVTMTSESGVGLAAPQIGIMRNLFLFMRMDRPGDEIYAALNPRIVNKADTLVTFVGDGCLSIPGVSGNSLRYPWVDVEYMDLNGNLVHERLEGYSREGDFTGIIFQHEYDHLQGVLFIDKLSAETIEITTCDRKGE